jgi:DNA-binding NtrC family response regulator
MKPALLRLQAPALLPAGVDLDEIVVASASMRALYDLVDRIARTNLSVLLAGETGVGKEVVARAIHERSARRDRPMRFLDCGALPPTLLESALFGHERGAFTGADQRFPGAIEQADGGTLVLDEVGELSPAAQAALLRVLESRRLFRLGGSREVAVDVRLIASTHRDLGAMCEAGTFRRDLHYRLDGVTLVVPSLRDRPEEIVPLAEAFARRAAADNGLPCPLLGPDARRLLERHGWPGNVRELRNAIERAAVLRRSGLITAADLPPALRECADVAPRSAAASLRAMLLEVERDAIVQALTAEDGNQTRAARALGLPRRTLVHKLRALGIRR